ncbi:transcriptional regulator, Crp/Fnr family [Lachnospiraceae bacterium KM106-2]|nr:transcriptional regulator, Crp/Fnr family [Lachnospiraceae bacterium KM106-2]
MLTQNDRTELQENLDFIEHLSTEQKDYLFENAANVTYEKGAYLHCNCNKCVGVLYVKKGELRVFMLSDEGREITLYHLQEGDLCILSASCVIEAITFDVEITAEKNSELIQINSSAFHHLSDANIYVKAFAHELATKRFSSVMWAMQQILFMSFDKRLANFLYQEMTRTNSLTLSMTHEQIAKNLGSAREVVTRMLKYFAEEGIVSLSRGKIHILDQEQLYSLTES